MFDVKNYVIKILS